MPDPYQLDPVAIRRSFDKAASKFDSAAVLHREVRNRLLERLTIVRGEPEKILDLGAGTAHSSRFLKDRFPRAQVIALDLSAQMLRTAKQQQRLFKKFDRVCADAVALPFRDRSLDWCISNLMLVWSDPPDEVFKEVRRVLKPGGLFTFTTLGPDSLGELRAAWSTVDIGAHVHRFLDMHDLGDALMRAGFAEPVMDIERIVLTYSSPKTLMDEIKTTGATTATKGRARHLGQRAALRAVAAAYELQAIDSRLSATFEIVYGQAWSGTDTRNVSHHGETLVPLSSLKGRRATGTDMKK